MDDPFDPWFAPEPPPGKWDTLWKSKFGWILIPSSLLGACWSLFHLPAAGKAIAALAAVVAAMSLRIEMSGRERTAWTVVVFAFVVIELRAIDKDRVDADERQTKALTDQAEGFDSVLKENQRTFNATITKMNGVAELSKDV